MTDVAPRGPSRGAHPHLRRCTVRFRQARGRPHEERPVREGPVSVASILITVTVKPLELLPANTHPEDVLAELGGVLATASEDWYRLRGHAFCVAAPSVT